MSIAWVNVMIILKKFNNNAVVVDKNGHEVVVMGNGLGFGVSKGDVVDENKIEKTFVLTESNQNILINTLSDVPSEYLKLTETVIAFAEHDLGYKFNEYFLLSLSDHLYHAILRNNLGENINNPLRNEIKKIYPKEYLTSKKIVNLIFEEKNIIFDDDEATFITLHLVNGQQNLLSSKFEAQTIPRMVKDILKIVEFHFSVELNKNNVYYDRFLSHLKTFIERIFNDKQYNERENDSIFFDDLKQKDVQCYECVKKIVSYIKNKQNINISEDEKFYLFVYLYRITNQ